ncbi:MAG: hypothetical protein RL148_2727 [Planctomycetota bacterium]|jgi:hypothetical protein
MGLVRWSSLLTLAVAGLVLLEPMLPWAAGLLRTLGLPADGLLRVCVAVLAVQVLALLAHQQRLDNAFAGVLQSFQEFHRARKQEAEGGMEGSRREAVELLVAALDSPDPAIRATSHGHLVRVTGQDLGTAPEAWRSWLRAGPGAGAAKPS